MVLFTVALAIKALTAVKVYGATHSVAYTAGYVTGTVAVGAAVGGLASAVAGHKGEQVAEVVHVVHMASELTVLA